MWPAQWPLWWSIGVFVACAVVILIVGSRAARLADRLADRTGLGEAMVGSVLLGASTSLPGIVTSVTAAYSGHATLAFSNAIGGIAAQTAFLGVADVVNRRANLEHQAASLPNIVSGIVLILLLAGLMAGGDLPDYTVWSVHPVSALLVALYVMGIYLVHRTRKDPKWKPTQTRFTVRDQPENEQGEGESRLAWLVAQFILVGAMLGGSGWLLARTAIEISRETGVSETVMGGLLTSVITSLPELVTVIAAVRSGALTLAVADIIGGNAFDVMFVVAADVAYRSGSIYHAVGNQQWLMVCLSILMVGIIVLGLVYREEKGIANIGFESFLVLLLYAGGMLLISLTAPA